MRASNRSVIAAVLLAATVVAGCSKMPAPAAADHAQAPAIAEPAPATTVAPPAEASGEALAWLAGNWCGKDGEQSIEETWLAPHANEAVGVGRALTGGRMLSFEFMRIVEIEGKLSYVAQPSGEPPTSFERSGGGDGWVRFENKQHDYPQRIEYRRDGEGLKAEIGGPGAEGKEEVISYRYERCN